VVGSIADAVGDAGEQQLALALVPGELCGARELGARLVQAAELLQEIARTLGSR
jgi:hypothetical protein